MNDNIDNLRNEAFDLFLKLIDKNFWESLGDGYFFAVKAPGEEPSFVEVRTLEKGEPVLNVYWDKSDVGKTDLLNRIHSYQTPFQVYSALTEQNLAQLAFDERDRLVDGNLEHFGQYARGKGIDISKWRHFPNLISFETGLYPKELDDEEKMKVLVRDLRAALDVAEKLKSKNAEELGFGPSDFYFPSTIPLLTETGDGFEWETTPFPEKESEEIITFEYDNEDLIQKVKALEEGLDWDTFLVRLPVPLTSEGPNGEAQPPFYPMALIATKKTFVNDDPQEYIFFGLQEDYTEESLRQLLDRLSQRLVEIGKKPKYFFCFDDRSLASLKDYGEKTGITVIDRRKSSKDRYLNAPAAIYSDVKDNLEKFEPITSEVVWEADYEDLIETIMWRRHLSTEEKSQFREKLRVAETDEYDFTILFESLKNGTVKRIPPKSIWDDEETVIGIFPKEYDEEDELRSFKRLKPPKGSALSYVLSVTYRPGNYAHIQIDGESTLEELINGVVDIFGADFYEGRVAMDNRTLSHFHIHELPLPEFKSEYDIFNYSSDELFRFHTRCFANEITLKEMNLQKGQKFKYVFSGRDTIQLKVLRAVPEATDGIKMVRDKSFKRSEYDYWW